jgi:hypothetical protein
MRRERRCKSFHVKQKQRTVARRIADFAPEKHGNRERKALPHHKLAMRHRDGEGVSLFW